MGKKDKSERESIEAATKKAMAAIAAQLERERAADEAREAKKKAEGET